MRSMTRAIVVPALCFGLLGLLLLAGPARPANAAASVQLCIALDGSGSISPADFALATTGLANALRNGAVTPQNGGVELSVVQFGKGSIYYGAVLEVAPTVITDATVAAGLADQVEAITQGQGSTPTHDGINLCTQTITGSGQFAAATRQLINIPTDGAPDDPDEAVAERDAAIAAGIDEIDAEAIGAGLDPASAGFTFLRDRLVHPQPGYQAPPFSRGGFVIAVGSYAAFEAAIGQKIQYVTAVTPTPSPTATASPTRTPTASPTPDPNNLGARAWYFAEGYTGDGFDEYITIMNPNPAAANVRLTYYLRTGDPQVRTLTAPASARTTVAVHQPASASNPGGLGRGYEAGAKVESLNGVNLVVERPMYFLYNGSRTGGHIVMGATETRATWYFAEGYTGSGFDEYLTILNPNPTAANVTITYYLAGGAPVVKTLMVPANRRSTVSVHEAAGGVGRGQEVSAKVESTNGVGVVAERSMYFRYIGSLLSVDGGHNAMGAAGPQVTWYFAEGYTAAEFDEYLTLMNPSDSDASVRITYYLKDGGPVVKTLTARANSRTTVAVHDTALGVGRGQEVSAKVEGTNGIGLIAERPMYFYYKGVVGEGHNTVGAVAPRTIWLFAEGYTGPGFDEYLTIQNPNGADASVRITYYLASGGPVVKTLSAKANARTTVFVNDPAYGAGPNQLLSTKVESTNAVPLVVERPMYFLYDIVSGADRYRIGGAHDVMGYAP